MKINFQKAELTDKVTYCGRPTWHLLKDVRKVNLDPWSMIVQRLNDAAQHVKPEGQWPRTSLPSLLLNFTDEAEDHWRCQDNSRVTIQMGRWEDHVIIHLDVKDEMNEWRVYKVDPDGCGLPLRITGQCGDAVFDEATGAIEISVVDGPTSSRHYIFKPGQEGWPEAYLDGWTEARYLRDRVANLFQRCQRLSVEKKALEDAIAGAIGELDQLIGPETLKSIRNPLAALLRPNDSCAQHCAEEIRATLEAVRARLQPLAEAD